MKVRMTSRFFRDQWSRRRHILDHHPGGPTEKLVLLVLEAYAGVNTGQVYMSHRVLGRRASITKDHAGRVIRKLESDGYLHVERRPGSNNVYTLICDTTPDIVAIINKKDGPG